MTIDPGEEMFVQRALAEVEKSEKINRWRLIAMRGIAAVAAIWFALRDVHGDALGIECTVCIMVGVMLAVCTAKLQSQTDRNAKAILRAIQLSKNAG